MQDIKSPFNRRNALKGTLAAVAAPAIITSAHAQAKVTWRVQSHWPKASGSFTASLVPMAKELEERTKGRFKLTLMGAGEIAKGGEVFNVVRRGVVQMGSTAPSYNPDESELMDQYYGVPGTLREPWEMAHLIKNLGLEAALNEQLKAKGVFMMAEKTYPTELVLKKKIKAGDDLSRIKVRSAGSLIDYLSAAGFVPQRIDGPELYQALATGVIDGAHWGAAVGALSMKLWEVAKFQMKPPILLANDVYVINLDAYNKLPEDLRGIFHSLLEERYFRRTVAYQHEEAQATNTGVSKMGVELVQFPDEVQKRMAQASKDILAKDMNKGPKAKEMGDKLLGLMKDLGYV
ncbi:ABC transporter substrate-binding protein [Melaminivora suipulveris]|uniref:ABC transporter substrate-binding protein n=1 Tax=Melaminivora suipulveris TaxID=2109913 RepID=A0A2R3QBW6_9BURK|nr:TRAP transporter substrate-binding protein DctP [Melaminivora suipulveris]AVO49276.1 ABC transporter substrate-binding protein [Melaminivora suipulveris]